MIFACLKEPTRWLINRYVPTMASFAFNRLLTPLGRRSHRVAVAAVCTAIFTSSPSALAFSQQHNVVAAGGGPSSLLTAGLAPPKTSHPSAVLTLRRGGGQLFLSNGGLVKNNAQLSSLCQGYHKIAFRPARLAASPSDDDGSSDTKSPTKSSSSLQKDLQNILTLVGAQALLLPISAVIANFLNLPNHGLGVGFAWTSTAAIQGLQWTIPLFAVAGVMRFIEPYSPALQGVTKATQRSVLAVMGKDRRPLFALLISILLGSVAGWGEEWLFRGVFQTFLSHKFASENIALGISGLVFGLLHCVTPLYAFLACAASVFFGYLYNVSGNLAVPMICHAVYDIGALMWAHWTVTGLTRKEQDDILEAKGAQIL